MRVIDHPQMAAMAEAVADHLGLSGFCGFDFMLTPSNEAYMLELNPRATSGASLRGAHDAPFDEPALMARARGHTSTLASYIPH